MVKTIEELPRRINEAFEIATTGRPGPVLVDLPKDITAGTLTRPIRGGFESAIPGKRPSTRSEPTPRVMEAMERAAKLVNNSRKPIMYVGQGSNCFLAY